MNNNHTTITVRKDTAKVLDHIKATGQSFDGFLKQVSENKTGKSFKEILEEAEEDTEEIRK